MKMFPASTLCQEIRAEAEEDKLSLSLSSITTEDTNLSDKTCESGAPAFYSPKSHHSDAEDIVDDEYTPPSTVETCPGTTWTTTLSKMIPHDQYNENTDLRRSRHPRSRSLSQSQHAISASFSSMAGSIRMLVFSNNPDYKRLKAIEARRRAILKRTDLSFFRTLLFYDGSVLQTVLSEPMMWITMLIYIMVRVGAYASLPTFVSEIGSTDTTTVGAFLTFFLVLFTNNAVNRFDEIYKVSMACTANIFNAATLASSSLPRDRGLRLVRYLNAAHVAGYVGLSETYNYDNFFLPINESLRLLTKEELERIELIDMDEVGGSCYREIIVWAMDEVHDALTNGIISETIAWDYRQYVQKLRNELNTMYHYDDQPLHFFIAHFTVLIMVIFLPLVAVSQGLDAGTGDNTHWIKDVIQGIVVFLQAIVLLGLRALSNSLSDPYGSNVHDLSVMHYVNSTWIGSNRMLNAKNSSTDGARDYEHINLKAADDIGEAWKDSRRL